MTDPLLESLKRANPVDVKAIHVGPLPVDLVAAIAPEEPSAPGGRSRSGLWRLVPAVAVIAATIAVAVSVQPSSSDQASPGAVRALEEVAGVANAQAIPALPRFAYSKLTTVGTSTFAEARPGQPRSGFTQYLPATIEQWSAADGSGRVVEIRHKPEFAGPRDERRYRSANLPPPPARRVSDRTYGLGELDRRTPGAEGLPPTSDLPTDASALGAVLRDTARRSEEVPIEAKTFEVAAAALMEAGASPELRSALYEAVANIDGVDLVGEARDPLGRFGTAVSIDSDYSGALTRDSLIFDPRTAQPLAHVRTLLKPQPWIDSRRLGYTVLESSGRVDDVRRRP